MLFLFQISEDSHTELTTDMYQLMYVIPLCNTSDPTRIWIRCYGS